MPNLDSIGTTPMGADSNALATVVSEPGRNRREAGWGRAAETGDACDTSHTTAADSLLHR